MKGKYERMFESFYQQNKFLNNGRHKLQLEGLQTYKVMLDKHSIKRIYLWYYL
jgi:hypothetical protein